MPFRLTRHIGLENWIKKKTEREREKENKYIVKIKAFKNKVGN